MANQYVYSGAAGSATGADWANARTTLAAAFGAMSAGDTAWVANDHAETQATSMTLTSPGTSASPCRVLCVLRSGGSVPPVSADLRTTATVTTTGNTSITVQGSSYYYGITLYQGTGGGSSSGIAFLQNTTEIWNRLDSCSLRLTNTNASSRLTLGAGGNNNRSNRLELDNTTVHFAASGQSISLAGHLRWRNTVNAVGGTVPTTLMAPFTMNPFGTWLQGVDLSAMGSGTNLVNVAVANTGLFLFENCKLGSSVSVTTGSITSHGAVEVRLVNCDSADTNYRYYRQTYQGTIVQETTIVRTGGASDGTTPVSRKMVSTANSKFYSPLASDPIIIWNETTGSSVTITVETVTDGVTLTDAECWVEAEYLDTSGYPISSVASDRAADVLTSGSSQTSSSETWTTTGLSSPVKQSLSVTFTPQEKGPIRVRVMLAKASTTVYFCPKVLAGSSRQYMVGDGFSNEGASAGGIMTRRQWLGGLQ